MSKWAEIVERWLGGGSGGPRRVRTFYWLVLVALIGAGVMMVNGFLTVKPVDPYTSSRASPAPDGQSNSAFSATGKESSLMGEIEHTYETKLKEILQNLVGVSNVDVLVTVDSTDILNVEKNYKDTTQTTNEKDPNGGTRSITEVSRSGDVVTYQIGNGQQPVVLKTIKPKVRGVVVVAKGAENMTVKRMISEAVERGLDVPANRVSVLPRKQQ